MCSTPIKNGEGEEMKGDMIDTAGLWPRLKAGMEASKLTQKQVVKAAGSSTWTLHEIQMERPVGRETLERLFGAVGLTLADYTEGFKGAVIGHYKHPVDPQKPPQNEQVGSATPERPHRAEQPQEHKKEVETPHESGDGGKTQAILTEVTYRFAVEDQRFVARFEVGSSNGGLVFVSAECRDQVNEERILTAQSLTLFEEVSATIRSIERQGAALGI
jgi:hypothetical protein